jgi:DNA repair exonuclease SbcCD ATPase subunit
MRLKSLDIAGFRGFPQAVSFDLDADAIVVAGVNGSGKTSFFDAVLWALCGRVDRLEQDSSVLVSRYSSSGEARVALTLQSPDGTLSTIVRRFDDNMHLSVQTGDAETISGSSAETALIKLLWPDANAAADPVKALTRSLTNASYLQQDVVRTFVEAEDDQARFNVVGELVGAGRVGELQKAIESSRQSWTRATTSLSKDLESLEQQRAPLRDRLARLGAADDAATSDVSEAFGSWRSDVAALLADVPAIDQSPAGLDRALAVLQATEQAELRRAAALQRLATHLATPPPPGPELDALQVAANEAEASRALASQALAQAQEQAAAQRRVQVELSERTESLRALAQLALQHLGDSCPVCAQAYDAEATRARLQALVGAASAPSAHDVADVAAFAAAAEAAERTAAAAARELAAGQRAAQQVTDWRAALGQLLSQAGLNEPDATPSAIAAQIEALGMRATRMRDLRAEGERLSLGLARAAEAPLRAELTQRLAALSAEIDSRRKVIESRMATRELGSSVLEALRLASNSVVTHQVKRIEPLLQRIFATVDPHPSLRVANFLTTTQRGQGRLWTELNDPAGDVNVRDPALVLSSSQLNVLAVAVFLSLNLAITTLPLQVVALDDPLQSLDNVNLLGLADLLRRVKGNRQVVVSTHDDRLAELLERKLRPVTPEQRTVRIDLRGWTPDGPSVVSTDVAQDVTPLRLVASA